MRVQSPVGTFPMRLGRPPARRRQTADSSGDGGLALGSDPRPR